MIAPAFSLASAAAVWEICIRKRERDDRSTVTAHKEVRADGCGAAGHALRTRRIEDLNMSGWMTWALSEMAQVGLFFVAGAALLMGTLSLR